MNMSKNKEKVVGKSSIQIPALKPMRYYSKRESDTSAECRASPSPCSSTTLSFLSTTSDEFVLPSESAYEETERRNYKWKHTGRMADFSYLRPSEMDFVTSNDNMRQNVRADFARTGDFVTEATTQDMHREEGKHNRSTERDVKVSSFSGIKLCLQKSKRVDPIITNSSEKKGGTNHSSDHNYEKFRSESDQKQNTSDFLMTNLHQNDFVPISSERTLTPPPDFIDSITSKSDDAKIISCQPNLDVMLSGAVRSSALLTNKSDFVPAALMPREMLREKSKSLSDLYKREKKTKRFLDRRKVIKMNLEDKDCCSHTEVTPSSMMTLAAELLVSKNNKAARLFSEARRKADGEGSEHESILPSLWVVPKSPTTGNADKKTASHLKPLVKQESTTNKKTDKDVDKTELHKVTLRDNKKRKPLGKMDEDVNKTELHKVTLRDTKKRKPFGNTKALSKVSCTPLSEQTVESYGNLTSERLRIHSEDVQRDLMTLTVADLVGTPDTVYTDTESEFDERDCFQPRWSNFTTNRESTSTGTTKSNTRSKHNCRSSNQKHPSCLNETAQKSAKCLTESRHRLTENTKLSEAANKHEESRETYDTGAHRCSSVSSNSSSLTTVSSLTLSSNSLGSPDRPPRESLQALAKQHDFELESLKQVQDHGHNKHKNGNTRRGVKSFENRYKRLEPNFQECEINESRKRDVCMSTLKSTIRATDWSETPGVAPKVPVRKNSIKVMDKLRKRHKQIIEAKAERAKIQLNAQQDLDTTASEFCEEKQQEPSPRDDGKHLSFDKNALSPVTAKGLTGSFYRAECLGETAQLKRSDENDKQQESIRHPSSLLISSEGYRPETDFQNKARDNTLGYTHKPEPFASEMITTAHCIAKKDNIKIKQTAQIPSDDKCWYAGTQDCLASKRAAEEYRGDRRTVAKDIEQLFDMPTETFRNGEISVVDGSKISLTNQVDLTKLSGKNNDQVSSSLYLSDLLESQKNPEFDTTFKKEIVESILLPTAAAPLQSSYQQSESVEDYTTSNSSRDRSVPWEVKPDQIGKSNFSSTNAGKVEIVRTSDLDQYFPEYKSVVVSNSDKMKSESVSHNVCAKPFSKNKETQRPNYSAVDSRHTKSLQNIYPSTTSLEDNGNIHSETENKSSIEDIYDPKEDGQIYASPKTISEELPANSLSASNITSNQAKRDAGKNSAIKLLTGGKNVYSSCVKITLCPNASENVTKKDVDEVDSRLDFGRINMVMRRTGNNTSPKVAHSTNRRRSFPMKNDRVRNNSRNVREVKTPEMKSAEMPESFANQPDLPAHSQVDEGDFAGVVDGPSKNVKEIRAMFKKGPDYADYAKPKLVLRKPAPQTRSKSPALPTSRPQSTEVAQQIIGLFKGALTLEVDDEKTDAQEKLTTVIQNGETNNTHEDEHISLKDKVASFNVGKSPVKENEVNNNINDDVTKTHQKSEEKVPYVEIITNPTPTTNGDSKKTVQQEKVSAESYDESLDQFYDILDELSSS